MRVSLEIGQNWLPVQVGENIAGDLVGLSQRPVMVLRGGFPELDPRLFAPLSDVITCGRAAMFLTCVCGFWIEYGCVLTYGLSWMFCGLRAAFLWALTSTGYVHRREFPLCTVKPLVAGGTHDTHRNSPFLQQSFGTLPIPSTTSLSNSFFMMTSGSST